MAETLDCAYLLKHDLQPMIGKKLPLLMTTDSNLRFDVRTGNKYTTDACLMVEIYTVCEAYHTQIINNVAHTSRPYNIADAFAKMLSNKHLDHLLKHGKIDHRIEQCIISNYVSVAIPCAPTSDDPSYRIMLSVAHVYSMYVYGRLLHAL